MLSSIDRTEILKLIGLIWEQNPHLRFCQLIGNCFVRGDNYFRTDDVLEKQLRHIYAGSLRVLPPLAPIVETKTEEPKKEKKSAKAKQKNIKE